MTLNRGHEYHERLARVPDRTTLLDYLCQHYTHSDRETWRDRVDQGLVELDGRPAAADRVVRAGQELTWHRPPWHEPEAPLDFAVLHRDHDLVAVSKPAGLPVLPGAGYLEHTLLHQVRRDFPSAAPLHRLGRWTSGLVLFALTDRARHELTRQWRTHAVRKRYRALASGRPSATRFDVDRTIGPVAHPVLGTVHAANPQGKSAHSHVEVLEERPGPAFLADVDITTGRPHQIRIHLAAAGHPLVGDPLYTVGGGVAPGVTAVPGDPGYALHAVELAIEHPTRRTEMVLRAAPPALLRRGIGSRV